MKHHTEQKAIAIVGLGAILPDAPSAPVLWDNLCAGRYSIGDVPPDRWDTALYYDADPDAPDKAYSKIGGFVREFPWEPLAWHLPIPPRVGDAMDRAQKWAISAAREALADYGKELNKERTACIFGSAMGGDKHYLTAARIMFPEFASSLERAPSFTSLPVELREAVVREMREGVGDRFPPISEDTMPGELANIIAGRVAALFDLQGPNYIADAACASAMAAMGAAAEGLWEYDYDYVLTGGIDANMSAATFTKFCKIGALSATGTRPFDAGADGFVMGEGAAIFLLRRLEDAERDGERIYAVIRGLGGSSDGRGKGITAPNPRGQQLAIERAWYNAGVSKATATAVEAHGTSTRVGDAVELSTLAKVWREFELPAGRIAIGSIKSNIGHLKAAAGAAGMLKTALSLHHKQLVPSLGFNTPNPQIEWQGTPFRVNREHRPWDETVDGIRRAGVSAFGFGGTNFHVVLEEYIPGRIAGERRLSAAVTDLPWKGRAEQARALGKQPLRGALVLGAPSKQGLGERLTKIAAEAGRGVVPPRRPPAETDLRAPYRIAIDYADASDLSTKLAKAQKALTAGSAGMWKALSAQGVFYGEGSPGKLAFLFPGQGSQYINMLRGVKERDLVVQQTFADADEVMTPLLGKPLSAYLFAGDSPELLQAAERALRQTAITQPAVLAVNVALHRLFGSYGITPDMVMGHSLGEYGALVASGAMDFRQALRGVSARGTEMTKVSVQDNGAMVAVFGEADEVQRIIDRSEGYVVIANVNSRRQVVLGGATRAVERVAEALIKAGMRAVPLPVSHAFHTAIVAPASEPLKRVLASFDLHPPRVPTISNVTGDFHAMGPGAVQALIDSLGKQVASPVQFVKGLETLYDHGARVFVEVGPKRALHGMVDDVLGHHADVINLFANHPKVGDVVSFNHALCGLYAAGLGVGEGRQEVAAALGSQPTPSAQDQAGVAPRSVVEPAAPLDPPRVGEAWVGAQGTVPGMGRYEALGRVFAEAMQRAANLVSGSPAAAAVEETVVIAGASVGLPGTPRVFDDGNVARMLRGETFIDALPMGARRRLLDKHITRLVKGDDGARFETIDSLDDVLKLAGRAGGFDLVADFGVPAQRTEALDTTTRLAIAAGIDALRDAGIPLVMRYRKTTTGTLLPDRFMLPEALRDETGVIFGSAFPGYAALAEDLKRFYQQQARAQRLSDLRALQGRLPVGTPEVVVRELAHRVAELQAEADTNPYVFDRHFIFKVLSMGHAQFAEYIGARGPNTQINAACASGTQALALALDWIRQGRCRRVVCVTADDVTNDDLIEWIGSGFLASGAAATDGLIEEAALPFDRRRHGLILGMGASGMVVESAAAVHERGMRPIAELLGAVTANSAFHGSRLDVNHIQDIMEGLVSSVERRYALDRRRMAKETVFISHETYTPARGGSAQAEVNALRQVFGSSANDVVVANTKGFTGHAMGAGIEDAVAVKILETGIVPPVANYREVDPELGILNLSRGGAYPVRYALRLGAGFGSQLAMALLRWVPSPDGTRSEPHALGYRGRLADGEVWRAWLRAISFADAPELEVVQHALRIKDTGRDGQAAQGQLRRAQPAAEGAPGAPVPRAPAAASMSAAAPPAHLPAAPPAPSAEADPQGLTAVPAPSGEGAVQERVLSIVAEQTGYPPDMLDLELDLEADLGIDTVKQAETFAAVRESYGIERDESLVLRDFPTLKHVIGWVLEKRPELSAAPGPVTTAEAEAAAVADPHGGPQDVLAEQPPAVLRRVPAACLRPNTTACRATGVRLAEGTRVVLMGDRGGVVAALRRQLEARGVEVLCIEDAPQAAELAARVQAFLAQGAVHGVYWLPALDRERALPELDLPTFREALRLRVKLLYAAMRALYDQVKAPGTFLVAGTRLGGKHGYDPAGAPAPEGGAVTGFCKSYKRERPEALVKAVDFADSVEPAEVAARLVDETLRDPGIVEVGHVDGARWGIGFKVEDRRGKGMVLDPESVFVVSGAAGSITAAIIEDLASAGGIFYLLDLTPAPDPSDPDLLRYVEDRQGLMRELSERIAQTGERATPAKVQRLLSGVERKVVALAGIRAVERRGGRVNYRRVDLTEAGAVASIIDEVRRAHGKIDVLVHAAGLEVSRMLPDKEPREFDLVFDVKAEGWFNLMRAAWDLPVGATVAFSSIAGRFGNVGQTDYAAANDLLCKYGSAMRALRPGMRAITVDWTAWADIGMASRGSIPKMMAAAGIDMLSPAVGISVVRAELSAGALAGEVIIAGALGALVKPWDGSGGVEPGAVRGEGPIGGALVDITADGALVVETTLDPRAQPFLDDHRIGEVAVLPGVMGLEAFAEAATLLLPGFRVIELSDVAFLAPLKFYRDEPRSIRVQVQLIAIQERFAASCRLIGSRCLHGQSEPQVTTHFTACLMLARQLEPIRDAAPPPPADPVVTAEDIYRVYFHGPAYQVLDGAWPSAGALVGRMREGLPPNHRPEQQPLAIAPRLVELVFQAAGVLEIGRTGTLGLPARVGRIEPRRFELQAAGQRLFALVRPLSESGGGPQRYDATVVDESGRIYLLLEGYSTDALGSVEAELRAPLSRATEGVSAGGSE